MTTKTKTFKRLDRAMLIDSNGIIWRLMTDKDRDEGRESAVVYSPEDFDFKRYTPVRRDGN